MRSVFRRYLKLKGCYGWYRMAFNKLQYKWDVEAVKIFNPKSTMAISRFIHTTQSILKLLPLGHRMRGDVEVL